MLTAIDLFCVYVYRLVSDLDLDVGMRHEVVVPVGIGIGAPFRGEDKIALAIPKVHHRIHAWLAAAPADRVKQQQWCTFKVPSYLSVVLAELANSLRVPIVRIAAHSLNRQTNWGQGICRRSSGLLGHIETDSSSYLVQRFTSGLNLENQLSQH